MDAHRTELTTGSGVHFITRTAEPFDAAELERLAQRANRRRGGIMS